MAKGERFCEQCKRRMSPWVPRKKADDGKRVCAECFVRPRGVPVNAPSRAPFPLRASLQVEAHDSSQDPTGVFHCAFCGSGQLVANGDGSIHCVFCNSNFTVQKQPEFSGIPQTQNGMQMPPPRDEQDRINDYAQGQDPNLGPVGPADTTPDPAHFAPGLSDKPQVIVESFLTPAGVAVDRATYLRHLALAFAGDDRDAVLAQVRASRQKEST